MSNGKKHILIVDDSPGDIQFLMENLKDKYAILVATSGAKALELAVHEPKPEVVLMDVMMPEMDGYETCRRLKENEETQGIDVIFVSANDTTEEILKGYDTGGRDYIVKPVRPEELMQKVDLAIDDNRKRHEASSEKQYAMDAAMAAIMDSGELGCVVGFLRNSFELNDISSLAKSIVEATDGFGLSSSVQLRSEWEIVNEGSGAQVAPLEKELLMRLKDSGRIIEKDKRLILNYGDVSQLIKNMPDDEAKRGRLRDHLAIIIEGADSQLQKLKVDRELKSIIVDSKETLESVVHMQAENKQKAVEIMDNVMSKLNSSFMSYGLSEEQEEALVAVVESGIGASLDNFEHGLNIDKEIDVILQRLAKLVKDSL